MTVQKMKGEVVISRYDYGGDDSESERNVCVDVYLVMLKLLYGL